MNTTHPIPKNREPAPADREPTLLSSLRALPRPVWILFFGMFLNKFGAFVVPFLTLYLTRRGHTVGEAGLAVQKILDGVYRSAAAGKEIKID